jgi:antagonist of KipI
MAVIQVLEPGLFTTVQDLGREGFGPLGVSPSGAADALSLRVGNRLVGNAEGTGGLEMTLVGGAFVFRDGAPDGTSEGTIVALAGSDFAATLDGAPVEAWAAFAVRPGQTLRVGATRSGARAYLCVRGGISVKLFLGSASTHILSGLGGFEGRALRKGDVLQIGDSPARFQRRTLLERAKQILAAKKVLRVTPGPQRDSFGKAAQKLFEADMYRVTEESNRMGLRLAGTAIPAPVGGALAGANEMISEGVALGAVQVPESGMPIILFVEQQTTGGYPKIANVISADFHSLGQLRPRDEIRFEMVTWETARSLFREQEELLASEELLIA